MVRPAAVEQEREPGRARSRRCRAAGGPPGGCGARPRGLPGCGGRGAASEPRRGARGRAGERSSAPAEGAAGPPEGASALGRPGRRAQPPARGEEDEAPLRSAWSAGSHTMALAEVVVCAVGRVVTLPAVEITAQATALLVLVMLSAAEDNGRGSPLFSGARGTDRPPGAETVSSSHSRRGCEPRRRPRRLPEPGGERSPEGLLSETRTRHNFPPRMILTRARF